MNLTLEVFFQLLDNKPMTNREIADKLGTDIRNVQRATKSIATAFDQNAKLTKHFEFKKVDSRHTIIKKYLLNEEQILFLSKLLVSSRSLNENEMPKLMSTMLEMIGVEERNVVNSANASERLTETYIADKNNRLDKLWQLDNFIFNKNKIRFDYTNYEVQEHPETKTIDLLPVHTFFDNYYFFVIGLEKSTHEYKTYRIDWMQNITKVKIKLHVDYSKKLNHGEEIQHNAYGYMGKKTRIQFEYYGYIGYVKDRFPSCRIIKKLDKPNKFPFTVNLLEIEVNYSDGVKLWLLGQTPILRVVEPKTIAKDIKDTLYQSYKLYEEK